MRLRCSCTLIAIGLVMMCGGINEASGQAIDEIQADTAAVTQPVELPIEQPMEPLIEQLIEPSIEPTIESQATQESSRSSITSSFQLSLDFSVANDSKENNEVLSGDWLGSLAARVYLDGQPDQFNGRIDATFGQHISYLTPQKTQDHLIVSLTPSRTIIESLDLRLLLEITAETQLTKGLVDTTITDFLDPLFLYQSLFLGKRLESNSDDGLRTFDLTVGAGYALQQTVVNDFILEENRNVVISESNPLNQLGFTLESGYSAIIDLNYSSQIVEGLKLSINSKTVGMTKRDLVAQLRDARVTSLFSLGLQVSVVQLTFRSHLVYDRNLSLRRELSTFGGFGFKLEL